MPKGVTWIQDAATAVDPPAQRVTAESGQVLGYDGYTSCPLVTSRNKMLLAEFNYDLEPAPSLPFIDTLKPRRDLYLFKRYGLPALYWQGMLKGRA
jgi:sulfide:quinone oxidoreductase